MKPLGMKAYGATPHLLRSRLGPGDHHVAEGQHIICTSKARDKRDRIIVTEKLDGSNVAIAKVGGKAIPLTRAGYAANTSPYEQHHWFAKWVDRSAERFEVVLSEGEALHGEWLLQAHGTRYALPHEPLVVFGFSKPGPKRKRVPWDEVVTRASQALLPVASVFSDGPPFSVEAAAMAAVVSGHGAIDPVEGAVWRVERNGEVDFLAKWVRSDKQDGKYLPEVSGLPVVWNVRPEAL